MANRLQQQLVDALRAHLAGGALHIPVAGRLLWSWFTSLHATRSYGMGGPNAICFTEIEAYARLYRWPMEARHIEAIRALDDAWLAHARATSGASPAARAPAAPITPEAFDAVFG